MMEVRAWFLMSGVRLSLIRANSNVELHPAKVVTTCSRLVLSISSWWRSALGYRGRSTSDPAVIGAATMVVSLQNGDKGDDCRRGRARTRARRRHLHLGSANRAGSDRAFRKTAARRGRRVGWRTVGACRNVVDVPASGIDATASADIRRDTWEKFAFLAANSAVTAVTRETIGTLRAHPATRALLRDAMQEAVALARAEGIAIADEFVDERMRFIDTLPASGRASMAQDLLLGARLELDWLSGTVVRRAERLGLQVPVHRTLYAAPFLHRVRPRIHGGSMKTLGVVGGIGPESTIDYYRLLVARYRERVRDGSYPSIVINSVDLKRLVDGFNAGDLAGNAKFLAGAVEALARAGAAFGLIAANTPHVVFDEVNRRSTIPLLVSPRQPDAAKAAASASPSSARASRCRGDSIRRFLRERASHWLCRSRASKHSSTRSTWTS
jgi:hypothetical protein